MQKKIFLTLFFILLTVVVIQAQSETCPAVVEEALVSVSELCDRLARNTACYGASVLESTTFVDPRPENFFDTPGSRALLAELREIHPQTIDDATGEFGVGALNIQANLPNTLPGQAVLFLLMGDARLTNDVAQNSAEQLPFQSFYFLPGIGQSDCYESEPLLTIQTPGNISVKFTFNGVETEMSPGTLLTITPDVCTIHRGNIIQRVGDETAVLLANQTVDIFIDDEGAVNVTNLRGISEREYQRGEQVQTAINTLAAANGWQEQFVTPPDEFDVEPEETVETGISSSASSSSSTCDEQHTVVFGDNLHRIAKRYDTSVLAIAEANNLVNPRLVYVGQVLCIPDPGSGFEPLPRGM